MKLEGEKVIFVHVTYLPILSHIGEMKTKPTQHSVRELREIGIQPDFIICRSERPIDDVRREKIALFCSVGKEDIISNPDTENIYRIPLIFEEQGLGDKILRKLGISPRKSDLRIWKGFVERVENSRKRVRIGVVGKYFRIGDFRLADSYVSVIEAVKHAAASLGVRPEIEFIDSKLIEQDPSVLEQVDGIIVPGGFGKTGVEGKIEAIKFAREREIPYLGLCFGLQLAVVEFARNVCKLRGAHTTEIDPVTPHPVIDVLPEQKQVLAESDYGGTMRLGRYPALLRKGSLVRKLYGRSRVWERHRHRYEVNPAYHELLERNGMVLSGLSPDRRLVEFIELRDHPFFVATQAHPEFKSRPLRPAPLFVGLIRAALDRCAHEA
jgi:CTP synthase